jgi:hypothetical protein
MEDTTGQPAAVAPTQPPQAVGEVEPAGEAATPPTTRGGPAAAEDDGGWRFEFHGYLRAPMRLGIGTRDNPPPGQSGTTYHAPLVPDDQYLSWQHTVHNQKDWAELFFSYGNEVAKGTVGLQGFNFTDAAWTDSPAQFGISQGWVTITPELPYENVRLDWKVGSFWSRYGMAGIYDAGQYDTYLFGRTHVMGETLRLELDIQDITLGAEHGIGVKRPNPSIFNSARFTLLNHVHGDFTYGDWVTVGLHHLYSWAQEEDREGMTQANAPLGNVGLPDGSLAVYGAEVRLHPGMLGYFYIGYSHISANDALTVAPAIEVLHSFGGGEFQLGVTHNYLDSNTSCQGSACVSGGNGSVDTILAQYEFSLANLQLNLEQPGSRFWGEGQDLKIALYGMFNSVSSDDPAIDGITKLKYGADVIFNALPWLGVATRFDRVQPNSDISEQSFSILSPRVIFRSAWVTHEEIQIQYSRYFYDQRECDAGTPTNQCVQPPSARVLPDGFGTTALNQDPNTRGTPLQGTALQRPDVNVFKIQASMWW